MATNNAAEMIPRIAIKGTLGVSGPLNSDYDALINKPQINGNELVDNKTNAELGIPTELADLTDDSTHRVVTDTQIGEWNAKSDFSGSYNDLTDVPNDLVEDANYVHTDNNFTNAEKSKLASIESGAEVNVQSDWSQTDTDADDYIKNKPTIPAAQVNSDWNASSGVAEILHKPTLGTAAAKNYTGSVLENSTDLVESGAVKTAIDNAISSVYKPAGNKACAELVSSLLIAANLGNVYNMTDDGVTTADFVEGAGKAIKADNNVVIVDIGSSVYKFDLLSGMVDLSNYVQKSSTAGLIKNDGTIDQTAYAKQNEMSVSTNGDQTTIQLKNGMTATVINAHQDISGKANKSEMTVTPGTGSDADKTTIQLKSGTDATVLTQHQDISGKVDKEQGKGLSTEDYTTAEKSKLGDISDNAKKVASSSTNGHIEIDDVDTTVYDDSAVQTAIENIEDELSTDSATIEGNPLNFSTLSAQNAESTIIDLEPIQDLHGYTNPWVGGAGKNKLPMILTNIKNINAGGTWNSNVYTINGGTIEVLVDSDNNVLGFKTNNTFTATTVFYLVSNYTFKAGSYALNGCPTGGGTDTYELRIGNVITQDIGSGANYTLSSDTALSTTIIIRSGQNMTGKVFYPMIRLSTETDPTFAPYENLCPISGRSEVDILGCGKNMIPDGTDTTNGYVANKYMNDDGTVEDNTSYNISEFFRINAGETYSYCSYPNASSGRVSFCFYDSAKAYISGGKINNGLNTLTAPNNAFYCRASFQSAANQTYKFLVCKGSAKPNEWLAYTKSNDLTINFGQTVYGGTLDVEKGEMVVKKGIHICDGTEIIYSSTIGQFHIRKNDGNANLFMDAFDIPNTADSSKYPVPLVSHYNGTHYKNASDRLNGESGTYQGSASKSIYFVDERYSTASDFEDYLLAQYQNGTPVTFALPLANPITIQLTPNTINLLKGVNNISTDGDKITLTYRDGKVATLGDLTSAVDNLDSKIDESKILTDTATGDKYILVVTNGVLDIQQVSN